MARPARTLPAAGSQPIDRNNALQMYGCVVVFVCVHAHPRLVARHKLFTLSKYQKEITTKYFLLSWSPSEDKAQRTKCPLHFEPARPCISLHPLHPVTTTTPSLDSFTISSWGIVRKTTNKRAYVFEPLHCTVLRFQKLILRLNLLCKDSNAKLNLCNSIWTGVENIMAGERPSSTSLADHLQHVCVKVFFHYFFTILLLECNNVCSCINLKTLIISQ